MWTEGLLGGGALLLQMLVRYTCSALKLTFDEWPCPICCFKYKCALSSCHCQVKTSTLREIDFIFISIVCLVCCTLMIYWLKKWSYFFTTWVRYCFLTFYGDAGFHIYNTASKLAKYELFLWPWLPLIAWQPTSTSPLGFWNYNIVLFNVFQSLKYLYRFLKCKYFVMYHKLF